MIPSRLTTLITRRALQGKTQQIRLSHSDSPYWYTIRGHNLPFDVKKPRVLFVKMCMFFASAYWLPYLIIRHHLLKNAGAYN